MTCLSPQRVSPSAPLTSAKDPAFSQIKGLTGSQLKEGLPLDQSVSGKENLDPRLPWDASRCTSHMTLGSHAHTLVSHLPARFNSLQIIPGLRAQAHAHPVLNTPVAAAGGATHAQLNKPHNNAALSRNRPGVMRTSIS